MRNEFEDPDLTAVIRIDEANLVDEADFEENYDMPGMKSRSHDAFASLRASC